jgi:hypothetical protein
MRRRIVVQLGLGRSFRWVGTRWGEVGEREAACRTWGLVLHLLCWGNWAHTIFHPFAVRSVAPSGYSHCDVGRRNRCNGPPYRLFKRSTVEGRAGVVISARPREGVAVAVGAGGLVGGILHAVGLKKGAEWEWGCEELGRRRAAPRPWP